VRNAGRNRNRHWQPRRVVRRPLQTHEVHARRRRLRLAREHIQSLETVNRYQRELKHTTLALVSYLEEHWRSPCWPADYDSWWPVIDRYTGELVSDRLKGRGAQRRLKRLLGENQPRAWDR
jgi:hypothetical protein